MPPTTKATTFDLLNVKAPLRAFPVVKIMPARTRDSSGACHATHHGQFSDCTGSPCSSGAFPSPAVDRIGGDMEGSTTDAMRVGN